VVEEEHDFFWRTGDGDDLAADAEEHPEPEAAPGGTSSLTRVDSHQDLYKASPAYIPPSLPFPTAPPGGNTHHGALGVVDNDMSEQEAGGGIGDSHEDAHIETSSNVSSLRGTWAFHGD